MNTTDEGIRKAAVLVAALDCAAADAVLECLPDTQARRVRDAVVALHEVDAGEQRRVRDEFLRIRSMAPKAEPAGIELEAGAPRLAPGTLPDPEGNSPTAQGRPSPPFAFLSETAEGDLADTLRSERPQTIALVLAHLPPARASEVLARLDPAGQAEVIRRLANLEETDPEIVLEVEQALHSRVARQWGIRPNRVVGMKAVRGLLDAGSPQLGRTITDTLGISDRSQPEPAEEPSLSFDELPRLGAGSLAALFRKAGGELAVPALLGAPAALVNRVLGSLPRDDSEWLRRQLDSPGPIRLRDVEEARGRIMQLVAELQRDGQMESRSSRPHVAMTG